MSDDDPLPLRLPYGHSGLLEVRAHPHQLLLHHAALPAIRDEAAAIRNALEHPLDFPAFARAVLPDDRLLVVIERDTPRASQIVRELWNLLSQQGLTPENFILLQPASWKTSPTEDPRALLPEEIRLRVPLHAHDPTDEKSCAYLASTAAGERIYLARELVEADTLITIGPLAFDPLLGVRGTSSALFPGLSDLDSWKKSQGIGHDELGPADPRPMRQKVDEIGWLLGLQMSIAILPAAGTGIHTVLAGLTDPVLRQGTALLNETCWAHAEVRAELVIVTIPADAAGHGWDQVAAGFEAGRRLVERNGRIVVLSEISEALGPGLSMLRQYLEPRQALRPLRKHSPPDLPAASRIAAAADWANLSLLSRLPDAQVEEIFIQPISSAANVQRLLDSDALTVILEAGQQVYVQAGE